jgi:hypothetical protein
MKFRKILVSLDFIGICTVAVTYILKFGSTSDFSDHNFLFFYDL